MDVVEDVRVYGGGFLWDIVPGLLSFQAGCAGVTCSVVGSYLHPSNHVVTQQLLDGVERNMP